MLAGGFPIGSSSVLIGPPWRAYRAKAAPLCATNRRTPASRAAASSASVPLVRSSLVLASVLSRLRLNFTFASAVAWCMIAPGWFSSTAVRTARGSSRSSISGFAPSVRSRSALAGELWVPITSWPASINWGTSRLPIAPLPPVTKTRIVTFLWFWSQLADFAVRLLVLRGYRRAEHREAMVIRGRRVETTDGGSAFAPAKPPGVGAGAGGAENDALTPGALDVLSTRGA